MDQCVPIPVNALLNKKRRLMIIRFCANDIITFLNREISFLAIRENSVSRYYQDRIVT